MKTNVSISVEVRNGKEKSTQTFEDEHVSVTRATKLWIENISGRESEFFETMKMWYSIDKNTNTTTYYSIKTSEPTPVESFRDYYITKIDEEDQAITFEWIGY